MSKRKVTFTGESPISIRVGEFTGKFEPNETYELDLRFALHLAEEEENFELLPLEEETQPETIQSLLKNKHEVLVEMAKGKVEKPESLTKQQLAEIILGGQQNNG